MDWYLQAIENKEIVAGGCIIGNDDPKWQCNDCLHRWGTREGGRRRMNGFTKILFWMLTIGLGFVNPFDQRGYGGVVLPSRNHSRHLQALQRISRRV